MNNTRRLSFRACAVALALGVCAATSADAVDLRSWDQKITNAGQRFVVLSSFNNEGVLDKETQLVWERAPSTATRSWYYADVQRCGHTAIGGRYGWRLPSRFEFMTLLDPSIPSGVKLPAGHPFIGIGDSWWYWTNSRNPQSPSQRSALNANGATASTWDPNTTDRVHVWCVRGAGSADSY